MELQAKGEEPVALLSNLFPSTPLFLNSYFTPLTYRVIEYPELEKTQKDH